MNKSLKVFLAPPWVFWLSLRPFKMNWTAKKDLSALLHALSPEDGGISLVRLGGETDGGYLIPNDFEDIGAVYSPGVASVSAFEFYFAQKGVPVFMADASVSGPAQPHEKFHFLPRFLGYSDLPHYISWEDWLKQTTSLQKPGDHLVQMDIEGAEYEVILAMPEKDLAKIRILALEVHDLDQWWSRSFFNSARAAFQKILRTHYVAHLHPNNCMPNLTRQGLSLPPALEITFHRRDRVSTLKPISHLPHPLDKKNVDFLPDIKLDKTWFKQK
jgi:hypothetical protein